LIGRLAKSEKFLFDDADRNAAFVVFNIFAHNTNKNPLEPPGPSHGEKTPSGFVT